MSKPAELSTLKDVWSGQSEWRFGWEMRLNVRLHNMPCSSIPTVGLAGPPENRVQMFYLTEELKYTLNMVSGWCSCFFSREANLIGKKSDDVSHHRQCNDRIWPWRNVTGFEMRWVQGSKCWILYSTTALLLLLYLAPKSEWKEVLWKTSNFRFCSCGRAKRHHQDLPFGLRYTVTSSLHVYQPCYCAVQNLFFSLTIIQRFHPIVDFVNDKNVYNFHAMQG